MAGEHVRLARELRRYIKSNRREEPPESSESLGGETDEVDKIASRSQYGSGSDGQSESPEGEDKSNQQQLNELEEEALGCTRCELSENRTQVVFADGDVSADVFAIGEGPGRQEDEQGIPFVGKSGQLLRSSFEKVGLSQERIYITNTVKCRPPENRGPRTEELDACRPYLDEQFDLVDPRVVLALGSFAIEYCLGDGNRVGECRENVHNWRGTDLVATYHPAYILRNNNRAQSFVDDLMMVKKLLNK